MKLLGIEFAPLLIPWERRLQTLAAAAWISLIAGGFVGQMAMLYLLLCTRWWPLGLAYLAWMWLDRDTPNTGGRRSHWVRNWAWWRYFRDYFPVRLEKTSDCELSPERNYLIGVFPHGLVCTGAYACFSTDACGYDRLFPGTIPYLLTLDTHYTKPFFREFALSLGSASASAESISYLLSRDNGVGRVTVLAVGGAAESFYCQPGSYRIILKRRKGFIRLALKNG